MGMSDTVISSTLRHKHSAPSADGGQIEELVTIVDSITLKNWGMLKGLVFG